MAVGLPVCSPALRTLHSSGSSLCLDPTPLVHPFPTPTSLFLTSRSQFPQSHSSAARSFHFRTPYSFAHLAPVVQRRTSVRAFNPHSGPHSESDNGGILQPLVEAVQEEAKAD